MPTRRRAQAWPNKGKQEGVSSFALKLDRKCILVRRLDEWTVEPPDLSGFLKLPGA
jgi:hypothetical protein